MGNLWKKNWEQTKQHFIDWWNHKGIILVPADFNIKAETPHEKIPPPPTPNSFQQKWIDPVYRAAWNRYFLSQQTYEADQIPIADTSIGPGFLALLFGSEPVFQETTVWHKPCLTNSKEWTSLKFDPENRWWKLLLKIIEENLKTSQNNYFVGCPDLIENIDILASLRGNQQLMVDMIKRPAWVKEKVDEINKVFLIAYQHIYDIIKLEDGSSCYGPFMLWGPGKTAKVQCDASVMFSPAMFNEFVVPALKEQCEWLDNSLFHLDSSGAICHLDALLSIKALKAIEFTTEPNQPYGNDPKWYPFYKKTLKAGKSLQIVSVQKEHLIPMIKELGGNGLYIQVIDFENEEELIHARNKIDSL